MAGPLFAGAPYNGRPRPVISTPDNKLQSEAHIQESKDAIGETIGITQLLNNARYTIVGMTTPRLGASMLTAKG